MNKKKTAAHLGGGRRKRLLNRFGSGSGQGRGALTGQIVFQMCLSLPTADFILMNRGVEQREEVARINFAHIGFGSFH